ncbi:LysR family transcriptional regulator [uncultured Roseovarius sp.]|uniref:LysR family transcriptional regulator n=1 Tax=uncultured Roseovarius sp. TaxID=293344 RepID=UPI002609C29A|nr:LysR family transcriptional regulator [uncultured Roseovarius sp.]
MTPFRQLTYVVAVADHGSIQAAAEQIPISQPAISAAIQKVEQEYGLKLFLRERPHKLVVSPVGRRFIAQARRFLESAEEFDNAARNLGKSLSGTIQLGCFLPTAAFIIPLILKELRDRNLDISLQVHEADLDELNTMLAQGTIDLALTYNMAPNASIEFETLIEEPPYVLLSKHDPLAQQPSVSLSQLAERDMVSLNLPITQQFFLSFFSQSHLRPKIRHQTKSYELVRSLVGAGEGYAILIMRPVTERAYDGSKLAYVPLKDDVPTPQYGLAFTNRSVPTKLVETFAALCRETLHSRRSAQKYYVQPAQDTAG